MPLPKKKVSRARAGGRRAHQALKVKPLVECGHCHEKKPTHRVCPHCGYYAGRQVLTIKEE